MARYKFGSFRRSTPLVLPTSLHVEHCYGVHGKGFAHHPKPGWTIDVLLVNDERETVYERIVVGAGRPFIIPERADRKWRVLGWRMFDGSLPLGELEAVDPKIAQIQFLSPVWKDDEFDGSYF